MDAAEAEILSEDFKLFIHEAWRYVAPGVPLKWNWHHDAMVEHLEAAATGKIHQLIINIPPSFSKSSIVSVLFPVWQWTRKPSLKFLTLSYKNDLVERDTLASRILIETKWFQRRWGGKIELRLDQNQKMRYMNTAMGYRFGFSTGSGGMGEKGDQAIIDDPNDAQDAFSETAFDKTNQWWDNTMPTRLFDLVNGVWIVVGQRLSEKDLSGHLLEQGGWVHLKIPMRFEPKSRCMTILPWRDPRKEERELAWPEVFPEPEVAALEDKLQAFGTAGQLQQSPAPAGGALFKREMFRHYVMSPDGMTLTVKDRETGDRVYERGDFVMLQAVDLATSLKTRADYFVDLTAAFNFDTGDMLIMDVLRTRVAGPEQMQVVEENQFKWNARQVGVESVGYQLSFVQQARNKGLYIVELKPEGKDKYSRALSLSALYRGGKVFHPVAAPWLTEFEHELLMFPGGAHDDQVDAAVYALAMREASVYKGDPKAWKQIFGSAKQERTPEQIREAGLLKISPVRFEE
jgi:predicted phage terminase large subunit-like protein